jgi:hypothetical protein
MLEKYLIGLVPKRDELINNGRKFAMIEENLAPLEMQKRARGLFRTPSFNWASC